MHRYSLFLFALAHTALGSMALHAQEQTPRQPSSGEASENPPSTTLHQVAPHGEPGSNWTIILGAAGISQPRYLGSDEQWNRAMPFLKIDYKGIVGVHGGLTVPGAGGIYLRPFRSGPWSAGFLGVTETGPRKESRSNALKGMGDRKAGTFGGVEFAYRTAPFTASLEVMKGADKAGLVAGLELGHTHRFNERWALGIGLTGVWGDKDYQAWEFGISPTQAARRQALIDAGDSDLRPADGRPFTPKAGMREVRAETNLRWSLAERWTIFARAQQGLLLNDAANSPLTRSKNQTSFGLGFGYRFTGGNRSAR